MLEQLHKIFVETNLSGRYISALHIEPLIAKLGNFVSVTTVGHSVLNNPIYSLSAGNGPITVLMWSQMHGNESTTTKALFDLFNFFTSDHPLARELRNKVRIIAIPMLNPDGANSYTRENAANVDLNRDFSQLSQPESQVLFRVFEEVSPQYCFNLHDQRTIFGVGDTAKPATISFLSPSYNDACEINETRTRAIQIITAMNQTLQRIIPGQIGRFDDSFNINCVGDRFQVLNTPTILFEAGHFPEDYNREESRKLIFIAIIAGINTINENVIVNAGIAEYLKISQNKVNFYDIVYKNVKINYDGNEFITNFASQFKEVLNKDYIEFVAFIEDVGFGNNIFGHREFDLNNQLFKSSDSDCPRIGNLSHFKIGEIDFVNGLPIN